jgi:hypothetical protein
VLFHYSFLAEKTCRCKSLRQLTIVIQFTKIVNEEYETGLSTLIATRKAMPEGEVLAIIIAYCRKDDKISTSPNSATKLLAYGYAIISISERLNSLPSLDQALKSKNYDASENLPTECP